MLGFGQKSFGVFGLEALALAAHELKPKACEQAQNDLGGPCLKEAT